MAAAGGYGILAGSGFAALGSGATGRQLTTRFGRPSSAPRQLRIGTQEPWLVLRHGENHDIPPHAINYRANLAALAQLGVRRVIALNTVGVIGARPAPGGLAVPDQLIDYSWGRVHSIYHGAHAKLDHVDFTEPFATELRAGLLAAAAAAGVSCRDGGVYGVTQGPRLETAAEVDRMVGTGVDYLGMTGMPEAGIARELGMDYAMLSLVVNHAAGRGERAIHEDIEDSTMRARQNAMRILERFLGDGGGA